MGIKLCNRLETSEHGKKMTCICLPVTARDLALTTARVSVCHTLPCVAG